MYRTSLPVRDLENFRPMDFCSAECTIIRSRIVRSYFNCNYNCNLLHSIGPLHYMEVEQLSVWMQDSIQQCCLFVFLALQPTVVVTPQPGSGLYPPRFRGFMITHNDALQSVGLLWTSDQSAAETSTWQHTTLTTDKHPCPRWDSNPQSQQASGQRPTP